jgi:phosphate starvation-inducible PhoH-like protein
MSKKNKKRQQLESKKDKSPIIPQNSKIRNELNIQERELTEKQKKFLELALNKETKIIFVSGPAGTSKTFLAVLASLKLLNQKRMSDILYIRSAVESADSKIGFLPGDGHEKLAPYMQPLLDKLSELLPKCDVDYLQKEERLDSIPIGFLRGLNWNAKCIIVDEAQNITLKELITTITRTGEFSKVFILGDPDQTDIGAKSGFIKLMNAFDDENSRENGIYTFKFDEDDVVRSGLVKFIIKKIKKLY